MFNLKKAKSYSTHEKMLRKDTIGPKSDDSQSITEKELPHRSGVLDITTEGQMLKDKKHSWTTDDNKLIEKLFDETKGYVVHRSDSAEISVPPINALVEKIRANRMKDYWEEDKESHWSQTFDEKAQQGDLPKWGPNAPQHDKIVLQNDERRFTKMKNMPVHEHQPENDADRGKSNEIRPLIGDITTADIDNVAYQIKTGGSLDYDTAIVAILKEADQEKRELTQVERKAIVDFKIARTKSLLNKTS